MKVLIADDDIHSRRLLEVMLSQEGYEVVPAGDGVEALKILAEAGAPRLVILDWMMPNMDGLTTCRRIRESQKEEYTYIVLLTAKTEKEDIITGLQAGADDYIVKPFNAQELKVRLRAGTRILDLQRNLLDGNRIVQDFVYSVTHDLRTPLIAMNVTMTQALEGLFGELPDSYRTILMTTKRSVYELLRLADTLLMVARYENSALRLTYEEIDLYNLALEACQELEPISSAKMQELKPVEPDEPVVVFGDKNGLRRVFINLLANAVRYASKGGKVEITFKHAGPEVSVFVSNNGPPVPREIQPKLFQRFSSDGKRGAGAGLGLYLCRRILDELNGRIWYAEGTCLGSTFGFSIPVMKEVIASEVAAIDR